ncbi:DUF1176 domain-containing protein [Stenotrophomonas tumulicola]|uniref:DUF1176 domain-containing protein n=1 Tax=Stenotrophomonas tumulicola TaxID=1685415 RepID=A0A7W3IIZ8_9GAMM|nr:DUF1176 domain-containing protein [Stenotrophomonas tumulicola]MBA8683618.1 DUF1176 domain-containing protein [Stenotrophomonas tumulicola]
MRLLSLLPLLLLAPLPALQAAPATVTGVAFTHNDWTLACDNTRTCRAAGYQPDDDSDSLPVSVLLTRHGGPDQPVSAELMLGQYDEIVLPARLSLQIDGADQGPLDYDAEAGTATLHAPQVAALLASLAGTRRIVLAGDDQRQWTLSGSGASAVLLKMDEFQGRLGTPGALMRKGKRAEASVPPALPVPVVVPGKIVATRPADEALAGSAALRAALTAATSVDDCQALGPGEGLMADEGPQEITVKRLSADKLLVSMPCWRGAYNEGSGYWVVNDRAPYQPELVTTLGNEDDVRTISASHKGRGLGDCWSMHSWSWDGSRFVPTSTSTSGMCRLVAAGGAWTLPTLVTKEQHR